MRGAAFQPVTPSKMQTYAGRALDFLQVIDKTIDGLTLNCKVIAAIEDEFARILADLQKAPPAIAIDSEGRIAMLLKKSAEIVQRLYIDAQQRQASARADANLHEDDGVVEAFGECISHLESLHDHLYELTEWVETHDALLEPAAAGTFGSVDDLFKTILG